MEARRDEEKKCTQGLYTSFSRPGFEGAGSFRLSIGTARTLQGGNSKSSVRSQTENTLDNSLSAHCNPSLFKFLPQLWSAACEQTCDLQDRDLKECHGLRMVFAIENRPSGGSVRITGLLLCRQEQTVQPPTKLERPILGPTLRDG